MEHFFPNSGENFFSPNSDRDVRSDANQSQIIGGDADEYHNQIIGGLQSNYWGGYIPHPPRVSASLLHRIILITCFFNVFNEQKALSTLLLKRY